jgi:hypothetical protein
MIKLSNTNKMPCKSWSLEAIATCPASIDPKTNELVEACSGCYAAKGFYLMPNTKKVREHNKEDWKRDDWVFDMVEAIKKDKYFRWFDSGDVYSVKLAIKILEIIKLTPDTKHWLPTRMYKFPKFRSILRRINKQPNANVRLSSDSMYGKLVSFKSFTNSTIIKGNIIALDSGVDLCHAGSNKGKCGDCRACWNKDIQTVAYLYH